MSNARPLVIIAMDIYPEVLVAHGVVGPRTLQGRLLARAFSWAYRRARRIIALGPVMRERLILLDGVQVVVSDRGGTLKGSAADAQGTPVSDYFALIFPEDASSLARLQRLANAGRSNHNGEFAIENLPPGSYLAVAVDDVDDVIPPTIENLRRFRPSATRFTIEPGRTTTVTLTFVP